MGSFEYKRITTDKSLWSGKDKTDVDSLLDDMGRNGWELVSVVPISSAGGTTTNLEYFFKRQRF